MQHVATCAPSSSIRAWVPAGSLATLVGDDPAATPGTLVRGPRSAAPPRASLDAPAPNAGRRPGPDRRPRDRGRARRALPGHRSDDDTIDGLPDARCARGRGPDPARPRRRWAGGVPRPARRRARPPALLELRPDVGDRRRRNGDVRRGSPANPRVPDGPLARDARRPVRDMRRPRMTAWLDSLEAVAPAPVSAFRGIEAGPVLSVRREVRPRAGGRSATELVPQLAALAGALGAIVETLPDASFAAAGGGGGLDRGQGVGPAPPPPPGPALA